eukprot:4096830-Pyramimonas_sp.AAC.1
MLAIRPGGPGRARTRVSLEFARRPHARRPPGRPGRAKPSAPLEMPSTRRHARHLPGRPGRGDMRLA